MFFLIKCVECSLVALFKLEFLNNFMPGLPEKGLKKMYFEEATMEKTSHPLGFDWSLKLDLDI